MNRKIQLRIPRWLLIAALPAMPAIALAQSIPTSDASFTFGSQWWSQDHPEAKYREYRDLAQGGLLESYLWRDWGSPVQVTFTGASALRNDQTNQLRLGWGAGTALDVSYSRLPHAFSQTARSPYFEARPGLFLLPDTLQRVNQDYPSSYNATMNDLLANAPGAGLGIRTDVSQARLRLRPAAGWVFDVKGSARDRKGRIAYGAPFGFNSAIELPAPVNQRTVDVEANGDYLRGNFTATAGLAISQFENRVSTLRWDNPKRITDRTNPSAYVGGDGSTQGQLDLAPDNRVFTGRVAIGLQMPRRTALTVSAALSQGEQDDPFLPSTVNSAIVQGASLDSLPARNLDGKVVQTTVDARVTSRFSARVGATVRAHLNDFDNQTGEITFRGTSRLDQTWQPGNVTNRAFGNKQTSIGADVDLDPVDWADLTLSVDHVRREHLHREIHEDDETAFGGRARLRPFDGFTAQAGFRYGDRKAGEFEAADYQVAGVFVEQPGLRRFDVASRTQGRGEAGLGYTFSDWLDVSAEYTYLKNEFGDSPYGLQTDEQQVVLTEATLHVNDRTELSGGYGFGQVETFQKSNETSASPPPTPDAPTNWQARVKDRNVFVFLGAEWWAVAKKLKFGTDYAFTRDLASYDLSNTANTAIDVPSTYYRHHQLQFETTWRLRFNLELAGRYGYEEYVVTDFANESVPLLGVTTGPATGVFLGDGLQDYRAHRVALLATRRF